MNYPLFLDLKTKLKNDIDLNEETFISDTEMKGYFNEAIDMVEAQVHTIYEDYFLRRALVDSTQGGSTLTLPSDIYANKIRKIFWNKSDIERYELKRLKDLNDLLVVNDQDMYRYLITNDSTSGQTVNIYPNFRETLTGVIQIWYIRNAQKYVDDTSLCDIPEFSNVITQYVRWKCHAKEGHPDTAMDLQDLMAMKDNMVSTLSDRIIDEDTEIRKDLSFYRDFDTTGYYF